MNIEDLKSPLELCEIAMNIAFDVLEEGGIIERNDKMAGYMSTQHDSFISDETIILSVNEKLSKYIETAFTNDVEQEILKMLDNG